MKHAIMEKISICAFFDISNGIGGVAVAKDLST